MTDRTDFLSALNRNLTDSTALSGSMPANLRSAAGLTTGALVDLLTSKATASRAVVTDADGDLAASSVTSTELGYMSGVTSAIQTQINGKEASISAGTTSQYWRGDKSWQTLDKTAVGLGNVDNTSDANKPVSTATQAALDLKLTTTDLDSVLAAKASGTTSIASIQAIKSDDTILNVPVDSTISVSVPGDYATVSAAYAALAPMLNFVGVTINVADGNEISEPDDLVIDAPCARNRLRIVGAAMSSYELSSVGAASGAAKNWSVPLTLTSATGITVGKYLRIDPNSLTGTGSYKELGGVWKVTDVTGDVVTIKHHHYAAAFPTMTASGAAIERVTSFLRFPAGSRGICVESGVYLENLHWGQDFDPATDTPADGADDGFQVGTAADTTTTGMTQSARLGGASVFTSHCGVVEFPANGYQNWGSAALHVAFYACSNGWRGVQSGEGGNDYHYGGVAAANGASDYQAEKVANLYLASCTAFGGSAEAIFGLSNCNITETGGYFSNTAGAAVISAKKGAFINTSGSKVVPTGGTGIEADNARVEEQGSTTGGSIGNYAVNLGLIEGSGASADPTATTPFSVDFDSGAQVVRMNGNLYYPNQMKIRHDSGGFTRFTKSSVGDLAISYSSDDVSYTDRYVLKSDGTIYPSTATPLGRAANHFSNAYVNQIFLGTGEALVRSGTGSPEGAVTAGVGAMFLRTDGGAGTTLYVKESGTGNTGWAAK